MTEESKSKVDPIDAYVGRRLKMRRVMLGLSQQDLGEAVNVSIQQIQKYEKATNRISSGKLYAFSKLLNVPVEFFYKDVDSQLPSPLLREEKEEYSIGADSLSERDTLSLLKSFSEIKNPSVRKKVLDLVKTLNDE